MPFDPHLEIRLDPVSLRFEYGPGVTGPAPEFRRIDDIRPSLRHPDCEGPDPVYAIAMDVSRIAHRDELLRRKLLFGVVAFARGTLGDELVRSQGHVHTISSACGWSTPELIEIWQGRAIIYMQETTDEDPGRCFAVEAGPGEKVIIPPRWAHCVINSDPGHIMLFGACCVRDYGFEYRAVRARGGLAWFPMWIKDEQRLRWERNPAYSPSCLVKKHPHAFPELNVRPQTPIYKQFSMAPDDLQWVSNPSLVARIWDDFEP